MTTGPELGWHQALGYALTGRLLDGLGRQRHPDPTALAEILRSRVPAQVRVEQLHAVPPALMAGIGAAQFVAALTQLRAELSPRAAFPPVQTDRPLTADERRLLSEVPPHHGS